MDGDVRDLEGATDAGVGAGGPTGALTSLADRVAFRAGLDPCSQCGGRLSVDWIDVRTMDDLTEGRGRFLPGVVTCRACEDALRYGEPS